MAESESFEMTNNEIHLEKTWGEPGKTHENLGNHQGNHREPIGKPSQKPHFWELFFGEHFGHLLTPPSRLGGVHGRLRIPDSPTKLTFVSGRVIQVGLGPFL